MYHGLQTFPAKFHQRLRRRHHRSRHRHLQRTKPPKDTETSQFNSKCMLKAFFEKSQTIAFLTK
jgi:hypothetical protein